MGNINRCQLLNQRTNPDSVAPCFPFRSREGTEASWRLTVFAVQMLPTAAAETENTSRNTGVRCLGRDKCWVKADGHFEQTNGTRMSHHERAEEEGLMIFKTQFLRIM